MKLTTRPAPPAPLSFRTSLSARLFLSFIGLTLAAAGVAFTMLLWRAYQRASETYTWRELPCVIRKSVVEETRENLSEPVQYVPSILYNYLLEEVSH